jgi:hypothetical protein
MVYEAAVAHELGGFGEMRSQWRLSKMRLQMRLE